MSEPITRHLIDSVLYLLISDTDFLGAVRGLIPTEFFGSIWGERIARLCYSYFENFRKAPREHFQDEFSRLLKQVDKDDHEMVIEFATRITSVQEPNKEYIYSRLNDFIRSRELEMTAIDVAKLVQRGQYSEAELRMHKALRSGIERRNIGLDYLRNIDFGARRLSKIEPLVSTGWKVLDRKIGGLHRGRFLVFIGKYKGRKTWAMVNLGRSALLRGLTVVHISHEMGEDEMEIRYDQALGSLIHDPSQTEISDFTEVEIKRWDSLERRFKSDFIKRPTIYNANAVTEARRIISRFGGRLIIKKYPMGSASMIEVDRYLRYLEQFEGVVPDVLINDYADIMAPIDSRKDGRDQINDSYIYHKRIADERNILVVTGSQATRDSLNKKKFSMKDFAEDIRKVANSDLSIGICQTDDQEELGISQAVVVFSRNAKNVGAEAYFGSCLELGQMVCWEADAKDFREQISSGGVR